MGKRRNKLKTKLQAVGHWPLAVGSREDENENEDENYHPDGL